MKNKSIDNLKLGLFVIAGLFFLVLLLYMIGKNRSMFGSNFTLKARFQNVQGLKQGNNVRFAGIEVGTVKKVSIIADTLVEVVMYVNKDMKRFIRKNATVKIGSDGVMGNKLLNIVAENGNADFVSSGDVLVGRTPLDMDEMLRTLQHTNADISTISSELKQSVIRFNTSNALWSVIQDERMPKDIRSAAANIRIAAAKASAAIGDVQGIIADVKGGKGSLGKMLNDTDISGQLTETLARIASVGDHADTLSNRINSLIVGIEQDVNYGKGTVNAVLKDSLMVAKLNNSLDNIEKGTESFNQNMDALKHNFLFRRYFKRTQKPQQ
jgi:phospholipid/cholesterol/gamma-HCH transport system substrate-binding protein